MEEVNFHFVGQRIGAWGKRWINDSVLKPPCIPSPGWLPAESYGEALSSLEDL